MTSKLAKSTTPLRDAVLKAWDHFEGLSSVKDRDSWFSATAAAGLSANIEDDDKIHRLGEKIEKTVRSAERQSRTWRAAYNLTEVGKIDLDGKRLAKDMAKTLSKIESTQKDLLKIKQLSSDDLLLSEVNHALSTMRPTIQAFEAAIKMGQRGLKMSTLQKDLIKLAYNKPHLRAKILPILERTTPTKTAIREKRIPKGDFAIVVSKGMDDYVASVHKTEAKAIEVLKRKHGIEPGPHNPMGAPKIFDVSSRGPWEIIPYFGKLTVRPKRASTKTAGAGPANAMYLQSIPPAKKAKILKHIANHYGVSVREIEKELVDRDAENLFEYAASDRSMAMDILRDFKRMRLMASKQADVQKTAINQDTQDFIDWIYTTRQGQALSTSEVVTALKKAGVVQKSPKKKRSGPRFQVGDEVIINFKKAKADPRFYPAFVGGPGGTQLEEKAWKKLDGKVGKVKQAGTGVTAKFGSTEIWMRWGQESQGIPLYKYFPPTVIEAKSPKLEIVYLAGGQSSDEAKLTVTNYLARGSQRGQQRPAYYYTGYSYGWRVGRNGPYFEILAQQRFQFNPDKVGDRLGQGGYAPRSFNPAVGQMLYLGVFNSRPSGWKSDVESWKAESSGE